MKEKKTAHQTKKIVAHSRMKTMKIVKQIMRWIKYVYLMKIVWNILKVSINIATNNNMFTELENNKVIWIHHIEMRFLFHRNRKEGK